MFLYGQVRDELSQRSIAFAMLNIPLVSQVRTTEVFEVKAIFAYWFACALAWFLCSSSRIWENKSWRYGLSGIIGTHRIDWSDEIVLVTGGDFPASSTFGLRRPY